MYLKCETNSALFWYHKLLGPQINKSCERFDTVINSISSLFINNLYKLAHLTSFVYSFCAKIFNLLHLQSIYVDSRLVSAMMYVCTDKHLRLFLSGGPSYYSPHLCKYRLFPVLKDNGMKDNSKKFWVDLSPIHPIQQLAFSTYIKNVQGLDTEVISWFDYEPVYHNLGTHQIFHFIQ